MSKISAGKTIIDVHDGIGIESITGNYLATNENEGVTIETKGWSETPQEMNEISKYLWSYETIVLTDGHVQNTRPVLIGVYGDEGVGIEEVIEYYLISDQDSGISHTDDWSTIVPTMTSEEKYLWNYEEIIFTDGTGHESNPVLIGVYGDKGTSVKAIRNFYLATSARAGVTRETSGFTSEMQDLTPQNKYLWNYEIVDYENPESSIPTEPVIIGVYGDKGEDAKLITLESSAQIFSRSEEGDVSPKTITMEGKTQSTSISQWEYSVDGLSFTSSDIPAGLSRIGNQITIDGSKVVNRSIAVRATDGTFSDTVTVAVVEDGETGSSGSNAIIGYLTNENITLGADSQGVVSSYDEAMGSFRVLDGIEDVTETEQTSFSVASEGGLTITISSSGEYSVSGMDSDSGKAELRAVYKGTELIKSLTVSKSRAGGKGRDGYTPVKDVDYFDGRDGQDGASSYTYIRYSQNSDGSEMDTNPSNAKYIGIAVTESSTPPQNNTGYNWSKLQGDQGIKGEEGEDGVSSFLHIKYSNDGSSFTGNNGENLGAYIGMYVDDKPGDSTDPSHYTWNLIKGDKGDKGDEGTGVKSAVVAYRNHTSGTVTPPTTGWDENPPTPIKGQYMWTRTITTYTDNSNITTYSVAYNALDGGDGKGITTTTVTYAISTNGSTTPTDWLPTRPTPDQGDYMWTRTVIKYTDGTESTAYNTSYSATDGQKGDKGDTGDDGISITGITEHYLITDKSSGVTKMTDGWTTDIPKMSDTKPYLWNYEETHLSNGEKESTEPVIMGHYGSDGSDGHDGRGIKEVTEYYLTSSSNSGVSREADGWSTAMKVTTPTERYLWNYGKIEYTEGDPTYTEPVIIGVHGEKGDKGDTGIAGNSAIIVSLDNDSHTLAADVGGNVADYTRAVTNLTVFEGHNDVTDDWDITIEEINGIEGTFSKPTYKVEHMPFDTGEVKFTAKKSGYADVVKVFSLSKSKVGAVGEDAISYSLQLDTTHIKYDSLEKVMLPSSVEVSGEFRKGVDELEGLAGYYRIYEQSRTSETVDSYTEKQLNDALDLNTEYILSNTAYPYVKRYESDNPEEVLNYEIQTDAMAIRIEWFKDEHFTQLLDLETIPVVSDGVSTYTHIAYADDEDGSNFSTTDPDRNYVGMYTSHEPQSSGDYKDYHWTLIKGKNGEKGIQGPTGDDGLTPYLHIAYANSADGQSGFSTSDSKDKLYIGQYTDYKEDDSEDPTEYSWTLIKGEKGDKGENAPLVKLSGDTQIIATDKDGNTTPANSFAVVGSSVNTSISKWEYSVDGNSFTTLTPTGVARSGNTVTINPKESTFTTLSIKATDGTVSDIFTIGKAVDGATGRDGRDAYTVLLTNESHTFAGSETSALTGSTTASVLAYKGTERIVSSVNSVLGVPNGMTYDISGNGTEDNKVIFNVNTSMKTLDGDITISLTIDGKEFEKKFSYALALKGERGQRGPQGVEGEKGDDGKTTYTWIRYADNANGGNMSNSPVGKDYIGLAHNKETSVESDVAGEYTWSLFRGPQGGQGVEGPPGDDGKPTYTWIRYSANANGSDLTSTPQSNTQYIGIATNKSAQTPSNTPGDYIWSLFKGPKGEKGDDGYTPVKGTDYFDGKDGQDGTSSYLWVRYSDSSNGSGMRTDPEGAEYIGTATTSEAVAPKEPGAYDWVLVKGKDGLAGESGSDGETSYLHIKYSNDGGKTFTGNSGEDAGKWIGTYVDFVKEDSMETDFYTWNKVKGEKGDQGEDGDDAILGVLDNESHIIPTDADGYHGNYVGANASMIIFNGHHEDTDNWEFSMTVSDGVTGSQTINTYTVRDLSEDTGAVTFKAEREGYSDVIKVFTLTKSKQGHKGEDATAYSLALDSQVIQKDGRDDSLTPGSLSISGQKKVGEEDFNPFPGYFVIYEQSRESMTVDKYTGLALTGDVGEDEYILSSSAYPYVVRYRSDDLESDIEYDIFKDPMNIRIDWYKDSDYTILLDRAVVPVVSDGKDAVVGMLTNEAMTFPADKEGEVVSYANNSGQFMIHDGARDVSEYTDFNILNQKNVVITIDERGYYSIRAITDGIDILDGEAILTASYKDMVIQKTVVVSKSLAGDDGDSATSYWISPSVNTVTKHIDESIDPKTITFNAMSKTGEEDPKGYSGRFVVQISNDGVSYSNHYTSSRNASSYTYSVPEDTSFIKAKLYQAGGLVHLLDEETIPVLQEIKGEEGAEGIQGPPGNDGQSQYVHMRYSANADGSGFIDSPDSNTKYIGIAVTASSTAPTGVSSYTWSKFIGENGNQGIQGPPGPSGQTTYTWVKYADDIDGNGIDDSPSGKMFIGLAFNQTTQSETDEPSDYTWSAMYDEEALEELRTESESLQEQMGNYVPESSYSEDIGEINQSLIDYQDALELAQEQIYGMFDDEGNLVLDDEGNPVQPGVMRDIATLLERTVALQEDFGAKTVQWSFLDTKFVYGDEGMFIGEPDTLTGIMISPATSNEPSRIDFLDGDKEKPVAFITSDLMRINRGIFVESATIGEHKIQTQLDGHTIWQWIP